MNARILVLAIALAALRFGVVEGQTSSVAVYLELPRTKADPRAKVVDGLRSYFSREAKARIRVVSSRGEAQFVIEPHRPYTTGTPVPYVVSGAGDDRLTAALLSVVGARVCPSATGECLDLTASARVTTMAMLQLAEKITKAVQEPRR